MARTTESVTSKIVTIVVAVVLSTASLFLLWYGGGQQLVSASHGAGLRISALGTVLAIVGILLICAVAVTARVTVIGVAVAGTATALFGIIVLVSQDSSLSIIQFFRPISSQLVVGSGLWMIHGFVFALGIVVLAVAAVARLSRTTSRKSAISALRGPLAIVLAIVAAVVGLDFLSSNDLQHIVIGAVLLGAVVLSGIIARSAPMIAGTVLTVTGLLGFFFEPAARSMARTVGFLGNGATAGLHVAFGVGFVATFGAILLATTIVVRSSGRRVSSVAPHGYGVETVYKGEH